jgi:hypothetical protein
MVIKPKSFDAQMNKACQIFLFDEDFAGISPKLKNEILEKLLKYEDTIVTFMNIKLCIVVLLYLSFPVEQREDKNMFQSICDKYKVTYIHDFLRYLNFFEEN